MEDFGEYLGYVLKWEKDQSILSSLALLLGSPNKSVITHGRPPPLPLRKLPSRATSNLLIPRIQKNTLAHYRVRRPTPNLDPRRSCSPFYQGQSIIYRRCMMLA